MHLYKVRPRKDRRGFDLISEALPFGRLWYSEPNAISNAINYAKFFSRSHDAVIRVYNDAGNMIETHEHAAISKSGHRNATTAAPEILPPIFMLDRSLALRFKSRRGLLRVRTARRIGFIEWVV